MKKVLFILCIHFILFACKENTVTLSFSETQFLQETPVRIEINIPKVKSNTEIANKINSEIESLIANTLNYTEDYIQDLKLGPIIKNFNDEYLTFKTSFEESNLVWEATFDGEVTYQSSEIISIPISSYINTGGAHGNLNISILNFNSKTGGLLLLDDFIDNKDAFTALAKSYFKKEYHLENEKDFEDYFFGENFRLPEHLGFTETGVLLFYNTYEIVSHTNDPSEFIIPFKDVESFLKLH